MTIKEDTCTMNEVHLHYNIKLSLVIIFTYLYDKNHLIKGGLLIKDKRLYHKWYVCIVTCSEYRK